MVQMSAGNSRSMTTVLVFAGSCLIAIAIVDIAWTTIAAGSGAGPLTSRVARWSWQLALACYRRLPHHALLTIAGVMIVFGVMATWLVLALSGWSLIFSAADGAVLASDTGAAADTADRLYFVGYTVFTLGNGEFRPGQGTWQLATVLASGTGLAMVTLSITYLVPVASAVADRRRLASTIAALGDTPHDILIGSWTGNGFGLLGQHLRTVTTLIQAGRQQHYTYPVLHYFHSRDRESAAAPNLANLSDAVLLLRHGVAPEHRPDPVTLRSLDRTIAAFLDTLHAAYIGISELPHRPPSLQPLAVAGIPVVDPDEFADAVEHDVHRRRLLAGLLDDDGWDTSAG